MNVHFLWFCSAGNSDGVIHQLMRYFSLFSGISFEEQAINCQRREFPQVCINVFQMKKRYLLPDGHTFITQAILYAHICMAMKYSHGNVSL
jgi:hypothetical protein